jgi:hypothetical protein
MILKMITLDRCGDATQISTKSTDESTFYKRANFKTDANFSLRHSFKVPNNISATVHMIRIYAKDVGKAGTENNTELPPPIDTMLFYGTILAVGYDVTSTACDLSVDVWERTYEHLFGGFENLADTAEADENEVDELDAYPDEMKTKQGYLKDGFVVDSDESDDEGDLSPDEYM